MTTGRHSLFALALSLIVTVGIFGSVSGLAAAPQAGSLLAQTPASTSPQA